MEIEKLKSTSTPTKLGPKTIIVDQMHRGDYASIAQAVEMANPGDCIFVRNGLYHECVTIEKPLEIIGDGDRNEIEIRAKEGNTITFNANYGRIANITLRQMGPKDFSCIDICMGRLIIEECDISSQSETGIMIRNDADPRLRKNQIRDCKGNGIFISDAGQGLLEFNDIYKNNGSGIVIKSEINPVLRNNIIHENQQSGIYLTGNGRCIIEENSIFQNHNEIYIAGNCAPIVQKNNINNGIGYGLYLDEKCCGLIEENNIQDNNGGGITIRAQSNPIINKNKIHNRISGGVYIWTSERCTLEDNEIFDNFYFGVSIYASANPVLRRNRINKNGLSAISIENGGSGYFFNNDLRNNERGAWSMPENIKIERLLNDE